MIHYLCAKNKNILEKKNQTNRQMDGGCFIALSLLGSKKDKYVLLINYIVELHNMKNTKKTLKKCYFLALLWLAWLDKSRLVKQLLLAKLDISKYRASNILI